MKKLSRVDENPDVNEVLHYSGVVARREEEREARLDAAMREASERSHREWAAMEDAARRENWIAMLIGAVILVVAVVSTWGALR